MNTHDYYEDTSFVVKYTNDDYREYETCLLEECAESDAAYAYLRVTKSGMTTLEATAIIAKQLDIAIADVSYAGRKDEDGVTQQYMTVPIAAVPNASESLIVNLREHAERFVNAVLIGYAKRPLDIGELAANTFRIVVRRVAAPMARRLCQRQRYSLFYMNYYDTQRFGMPDRPKLTHKVGEHLVRKEWQQAFDTVLRAGTHEARTAKQWKGDAAAFFDSLEPRARDFFLSAMESCRWNEKVSQLARNQSQGELIEHSYEGLTFVYPTSAEDVTRIATQCQIIPYRRCDSRSGSIHWVALERPTVNQVLINIEGQREDEYFAGYSAVTLSFTLPQGAYATMVLRQLELQMAANLKKA